MLLSVLFLFDSHWVSLFEFLLLDCLPNQGQETQSAYLPIAGGGNIRFHAFLKDISVSETQTAFVQNSYVCGYWGYLLNLNQSMPSAQ